jgi:hypothetical protein
MVSIVIFNVGDYSTHKKVGNVGTHCTYDNHEHNAKFSNQSRLKCALDFI